MTVLGRRHVPLALLALCGAAACASDEPSTPLFRGTVVAILDAPDDGVLIHQQALQLRAEVRDADGNPFPDVPVTWRSSDETRASVTPDGLVSALGLGEFELRATAGGATDARAMSVRSGVPVPTDDDPVTSTMLDGAVRITVPPGAVPPGRVLHLRAATDTPADERIVGGTAIELGPASMRFDESVVIALAVPENVPAAERVLLRLAMLDDGEWKTVGGSAVEFALGRVRASIRRAGTYAIQRRNPPKSLELADGNGQQAGLGGTVPVAPSVIARDDASEPVPGAIVRFSVTAGGGAIVGADSGVSGPDGVAALIGQWRLGNVAGVNGLRAALPGAGVAAVDFTAVATAQLQLVVSHPEVNFDAEVGANPPPRFVDVTAGGPQAITGLVVGPIAYVMGEATGWLGASLDRSATPAVLRLAPVTASLPPRDYMARVPLRSTTPNVLPETVDVRIGVRQGAVSGLVVTRQIAGAVSGRVATTQPRVEFRTATGAIAPVAEPVTVSIASGTGTLVGTTTVTAVQGVASFVGLRLDGYGPHRLRFTSGTPSVDGATFTVTQALAALEIEVEPGDATEDRAFGQQPVIRLLDDAGILFQPAKTVTASVASGEGELEGNESVASVAGIARFTNLRIEDGTGVHTLRFRTSSPTRTIVSAPFTVAPD